MKVDKKTGWSWYNLSGDCLSLPGWYLRVYPASCPLLRNGGPHVRVTESKLWTNALRKDGRSGTEKESKISQGSVCDYKTYDLFFFLQEKKKKIVFSKVSYIEI